MLCCGCDQGPAAETVDAQASAPDDAEPKASAASVTSVDAQAAKPSSADRIYTIRLTKSTPGAKIGLDVQTKTMLRIVNIKEGLVMTWNEENPEMTVQVGDCIVDINGVVGNPKDILNVILTAEGALLVKLSRCG